MKYNNSKKHTKKWIVKFVSFAILNKKLIIFTTNTENANHAILDEARNVILRIQISYQIKGKFIMKKIEIYYLQSLK